MNKKRADLLLFEKKLANSRTHAQELIKNKKVFYVENQKKILILKPSEELSEDLPFHIKDEEGPIFVSRAGNKLFYAIQELTLDLNGKTILDVGVSTGGFSDCVLQLGAKKVIGLEVGHGQTAPAIINHPQFQLFEGVNARYLATYSQVITQFPSEGFDLMVMDVSFISIKLILPGLISYLKEDQGKILTLVKPQFELGPQNLNRSGIVKNANLYPQLEEDMIEFVEGNKLKVIKYFSSKVLGKDGNKEFFMYLERLTK